MRSEEVSRVISVTHTSPILVAIIAAPILDETLGYTEWLAIFLTVAGAVLISIRWSTHGQNIRLRKSFITLIISSLLFGVANVASKYSLNYISFWNMFSVNAFCFGAVFGYWIGKNKMENLKHFKERKSNFQVILSNEKYIYTNLSLLIRELFPLIKTKQKQSKMKYNRSDLNEFN